MRAPHTSRTLHGLRAELAATRLERTRRDSFLTALLETVDVGIISCSPNGTDWTLNRAGREIIGLHDITAGDWTHGRLLRRSTCSTPEHDLVSGGGPTPTSC